MKKDTEVKSTAMLLDDAQLEMTANSDKTFNLGLDLPDNTKACTVINEQEAYHMFKYLQQFFED